MTGDARAASGWVTRVFAGLLPAGVLVDGEQDYERVQDTPLRLLGLDSLAIVELVCRIEQECGSAVDLDELDIEDLSTMRRVERLIDAKRMSPPA